MLIVLDIVSSITLGLTNRRFYSLFRRLCLPSIPLSTPCFVGIPSLFPRYCLGILLADWLRNLQFDYHFGTRQWRKFTVRGNRKVFVFDMENLEAMKRKERVGAWERINGLLL